MALQRTNGCPNYAHRWSFEELYGAPKFFDPNRRELPPPMPEVVHCIHHAGHDGDCHIIDEETGKPLAIPYIIDGGWRNV